MKIFFSFIILFTYSCQSTSTHQQNPEVAPTSVEAVKALLSYSDFHLKKSDYGQYFENHNCGASAESGEHRLGHFFSMLFEGAQLSDSYYGQITIGCREGEGKHWRCDFNLIERLKSTHEFVSNRDFAFHLDKQTHKLIPGTFICLQSY